MVTALLIWVALFGNISPHDFLNINDSSLYDSPNYDTQQSTTVSPYYVSKNGNNSDGLSWDTAWNELDQINWGVIQPGDVIYLDGGNSQMIYATELHIGQSGAPNQPIRILASVEEGHTGQIVFFGGRDVPLPYCGQPIYDNANEDLFRYFGINTQGHNHIEIDGMDWRGILIHGFTRSGIEISPDSTNITVRNVEIHNNGVARQDDNGWRPDLPGVRLGGTNVVFQRAIVHDNGQDAFQGSNQPQNVNNFRLEQSWLYNGRQHPTQPGLSWNNCTHTDGIQIYAGGVISGITVQESVIGPGFMQNLILGQTPNMFNESADVQDVNLQDVLLMKAESNNIYGYSDTNSQNWNINRVTVHCPTTSGQCLQIHNANHSITNSIFYGGRIYLPDGLNQYSGNCVWNLISSSVPLGENLNPEFVNVSDTNNFSLDDYSLMPSSPCLEAGSRLHSVDQLFGIPDS